MTGRQTDMGFAGGTPAKKPRRKRGDLPSVLTRFRQRGIQVTDADIADAVRGNSHSCMIAEAIKRQVPGVKNVSVDVQSILFTEPEKNRRVSCLTPAGCQMALIKFDRGIPVKPFSFNLQSVQVVARNKSVSKIGADGAVLTRPRVERRVRADGSVSEKTYEYALRESVVLPAVTKVLTASGARSPSELHYAGGELPGRHVPSLGGDLPRKRNAPTVTRKFGARRYTWDDIEDKDVVSERLAAAWGEEPAAWESNSGELE